MVDAANEVQEAGEYRLPPMRLLLRKLFAFVADSDCKIRPALRRTRRATAAAARRRRPRPTARVAPTRTALTKLRCQRRPPRRRRRLLQQRRPKSPTAPEPPAPTPVRTLPCWPRKRTRPRKRMLPSNWSKLLPLQPRRLLHLFQKVLPRKHQLRQRRKLQLRPLHCPKSRLLLLQVVVVKRQATRAPNSSRSFGAFSAQRTAVPVAVTVNR